MTALPWNHQDQTEMPPKWEKYSRQIILFFALIMAVSYTWISMATPYRLGHDQTYLGTFLAKDQDPTLYLRDYAFRDDTLYRSYIPAYRWLIANLIKLTGSFDRACSLWCQWWYFFSLWGQDSCCWNGASRSGLL